MRKSVYSDETTEMLIAMLCRYYDNERKYARVAEGKIARELERRGVINAEKFINIINK